MPLPMLEPPAAAKRMVKKVRKRWMMVDLPRLELAQGRWAPVFVGHVDEEEEERKLVAGGNVEIFVLAAADASTSAFHTRGLKI